MAIMVQQSKVFTTKDGREFSSREAAEAHEAISTAYLAYERARMILGDLLAKLERTADGQPFRFGVFHDYFYINPAWGGRPHLETVNYCGRNWEYNLEEYSETGEIKLLQTNNGRESAYRVSELYVSKAKAEAALIPLLEEWLEKQRVEIAQMKAGE